MIQKKTWDAWNIESQMLCSVVLGKGGAPQAIMSVFCLKMMSQKYADKIYSYRYLDRYCNVKVPDFFQVSAAQEENRQIKTVSGFVSL